MKLVNCRHSNKIYGIVINKKGKFLDNLTARQYGEVVLPDDSTDQKAVPVGNKAVTVQGGYGVLFAIQVQIFVSITSVAVQV